MHIYNDVSRLTMPGTAGGMVREKAVTVARATCSGLALLGQAWPGVTMFGFSS